MRTRLRRFAPVALALALIPVRAVAQGRLETLYTFPSGVTLTKLPLIEMPDGLYGITQGGGTYGQGTLFRLTLDGVVTTVHSFAQQPSQVTPASGGGFYGVTATGGSAGFGTIFRLDPQGIETTIFEFSGAPDTYRPRSIIEAPDGTLYGMTERLGYSRPDGAVFKLTTAGEYSVLLAFWNVDLTSPLLRTADGALWGTFTCNLFRVTPEGGSTGFASNAGMCSGVSIAPDGAVYGNRYGDLVRANADGTLTTIHDFWSEGPMIAAPNASRDGAFLYEITIHGVYRYRFADGTARRVAPALTQYETSPLVEAADGRLYGQAPGSLYRVTLPRQAGFDDDQTADLPFYDASTGAWHVLLSNGDFRTSRVINWGGPGFTPVPADYDGDGRLDAALYRAVAGTWQVLTSSSNFTSVISFSWGGPGYTPVPADYDGDGMADIAVYHAASGRWYVLESAAGYGAAMTIALGGRGFVPVPGYYDADGKIDPAVYAPATGAWRVQTSGSAYVSAITATLGGPGYLPVPSDYDGDLRTDFAVYGGAGGDWIVLTSTSGFVTRSTRWWGGTGYAAVPADYDGDSISDVAVYNAGSGEWYVLQSSSGFTTTLRVVFGASLGQIVSSRPPTLTWNDAIRATDYDGDGISDLAVFEPATGQWSILESSAAFQATSTIDWGGVGDVPVPGDFDGDGFTDAAVFNDVAGVWSVKLGFGRTFAKRIGHAGDVPVARDYDGDFVTDIAVYSPSLGEWTLRMSRDNFRATVTIGWGHPGWTPVPGDYDGDGIADLGVYQASTATWAVLLSKDNYSTWMFMQWGGPGYSVVHADFDGDGRDDFAACHAAGQWWVLKSGFGYTTAFGVPWGEAIDTPLTGDYDGDGIADMASYDSTTGEWYLRLSSSDFTLTVERTLGGPGFVLPRMP